jgi:hypothetical protein
MDEWDDLSDEELQARIELKHAAYELKHAATKNTMDNLLGKGRKENPSQVAPPQECNGELIRAEVEHKRTLEGLAEQHHTLIQEAADAHETTLRAKLLEKAVEMIYQQQQQQQQIETLIETIERTRQHVEDQQIEISSLGRQLVGQEHMEQQSDDVSVGTMLMPHC